MLLLMQRRERKDKTGATTVHKTRFQNFAIVAVELPEGWRYPEHVHDNAWQILLVREGEVEAIVDEVAYRAKAGEFLIYPPGARHAERLVTAGPARAVYIGFRARHERADLKPHLLDLGGHAARLVDWMLERSPPSSAEDWTFLDAQLELLLLEFERPTRRDTLVDRVRHRVAGRLTETWSLEVLAKKEGMSRFHFARVFRKASGTTPGRFVRRLRVDAARVLIEGTTLPLKAIAEQTGFADEFHLSKTFRQEIGTPPKRWRKEHPLSE